MLADLYCMLLNNLTKHNSICEKLTPSPPTDGGGVRTPHIDNLIEIFIRGESKKYNPNANFDFLGGVFANLSAVNSSVFLENEDISKSRLGKLLGFTNHELHPSVIRRDAVASVIKNCCFQSHQILVLSDDVLVAILLPLCGPEDFDEDVRRVVYFGVLTFPSGFGWNVIGFTTSGTFQNARARHQNSKVILGIFINFMRNKLISNIASEKKSLPYPSKAAFK